MANLGKNETRQAWIKPQVSGRKMRAKGHLHQHRSRQPKELKRHFYMSHAIWRSQLSLGLLHPLQNATKR
jgi:hypothetical protein